MDVALKLIFLPFNPKNYQNETWSHTNVLYENISNIFLDHFQALL